MRKLLHVIVICFILFDAKAIAPSLPFLGYSPSKPFNYLILSNNRIGAEKIYYKALVNTGDVLDGYVYYRHSADGLKDTITDTSSSYNEITILYDSEGRVSNYKSPVNNINETYTYTDDGKLLSINTDYGNTICYYTNTGTDSIVQWHEHPYYGLTRSMKEVVTYNNDGYVKAAYRYIQEKGDYVLDYQWEYIFDDKERIVFIDDLDHATEDEYSNDVRYTYYEDRVEELIGNHTKKEYYFDGEGNWVKQLWYKWGVDEYWFLWEAYEWTYYYDGMVSNESIKRENGLRISSDKGVLYIDNDCSTELVIVSDMSGHIIVNQKLPEGRNAISICKAGIYIVKIGDEALKVVVR